MNYYLLVYDRRKRQILEREDFSLSERAHAFDRRLEKMLERREDTDVEVVLFGADTFADLAKTHSRYFESPTQILAGIDPIRR